MSHTYRVIKNSYNEQPTALLGTYVYIPSYRCDDKPAAVTDH